MAKSPKAGERLPDPAMSCGAHLRNLLAASRTDFRANREANRLMHDMFHGDPTIPLLSEKDLVFYGTTALQ